MNARALTQVSLSLKITKPSKVILVYTNNLNSTVKNEYYTAF